MLNNPVGHFSFLTPSLVEKEECIALAVPSETAKHKNCVVAVNAGFFRELREEKEKLEQKSKKESLCLGNIVMDGRIVQRGKTQNVIFGVTKLGRFILGYPNEEGLLL